MKFSLVTSFFLHKPLQHSNKKNPFLHVTNILVLILCQVLNRLIIYCKVIRRLHLLSVHTFSKFA